MLGVGTLRLGQVILPFRARRVAALVGAVPVPGDHCLRCVDAPPAGAVGVQQPAFEQIALPQRGEFLLDPPRLRPHLAEIDLHYVVEQGAQQSLLERREHLICLRRAGEDDPGTLGVARLGDN